MSFATALIAVVLLLAFAPISLGGPFSYATVNGDSMEPGLHTDDLVLLRRASDYSVGDVVAYRHPEIGTVLHRIVADDGERFTIRGDNREGNDDYRPTRSEVIGRKWAMIPAGGRVIRSIQSPRNAALLVIAALAVVAAGAAKANGGLPGHRRPRLPLRAPAPALRSAPDFSAYAPTGRTILGVAIAAGAASFVLLVLWRIEGSTVPSSEQIQYEEHGTFSYGRVVGDGVYDYDTLAPPAPVFRKLLDDLPLRYDYSIQARPPATTVSNVLGSYDVIAEIGNEVGWKRTFTLVPTTLIVGDRLEASTTIMLGDLDRQIEAVAEATGISQGTHALRVTARVQTRGELDGLPFQRTHQQSLSFRLTDLQLQFNQDGSDLDVLDTGSISRPIAVPRELSAPLVPLSLKYSRIPVLAFSVLVLATAAGLAVAFSTYVVDRDGEPAKIRARFGRLLVRLQDADQVVATDTVAVGRIEDLVRIAESEGVAIMHRTLPDGDEYLVAARDVTWRYAIGTPRVGPPPAPARPPRELINATEG